MQRCSRWGARLGGAFALTLSACADEREPSGVDSGVSVSVGPGEGSGGDDEGPLDEGLDETSLDDDGNATAPADDGGSAPGCKKVDFLFVIDGSGSMGDNQDSLIASFPGFIESIRSTLVEANDYHIMVVDTDAAWGGQCELLCGIFGNTCPDLPQYPCGQGPPTPCDATLGAGVNHTMASDSPNVACNFSTGKRFMDSNEPDLSAAFQCAAKVGSDGDSNEKPMSAMVSALSPELIAPGACNEGFVREDAILVITVITDEEDAGSTGIPEGWFANVVASKGGDASAIVMLGLINDNDMASPVCDPLLSQDPVKLRTFVGMFPNQIRGSVCAPSYNDFFQQAVDLIDTTCDDFVPPG